MKNLNRTLILIVALAFIGISYPGCDALAGIKGSGKISKKEVKIENVKKIALDGSATVLIKQGTTESVIVETDDNLHKNIIAKVSSGELLLTTENNISPTKLVFHLTIKNLEAVSLNGSGKIISDSSFNFNNLNLELNGTGNIKFSNLSVVEMLRAFINGSGDMELKGTGEKILYSISGSGNIIANDLKCKLSSVKIEGSGDVKLWVTDTLKVIIAGSGDVLYKGEPKIEKEIMGSGSVNPLK
jgi:hypothetical protein